MANHYDWNKITEKQKKDPSSPLRMTSYGQKPIFIAGSREMSEKRIKQLAQLAKQKPILWGILKDEYIPGLEGSPQFRSQKQENLSPLIKGAGGISTIRYHQRDWKYLLKELDFSTILLVNGSWHKMLHTLPEFWEIHNKKTPYKLISPFINELEAKNYEEKIRKELEQILKYDPDKTYTDEELLKLANEAKKGSWDWVYQIGGVLAKNGKILIAGHNYVMPYESYTAHVGSIREKNFAPVGDLNYYDTNHAEMEMLSQIANSSIDIWNSTLYVNVLPCPTCAKTLARTNISEIVYSLDHSDGYAVKLFEECGKKVRRIIL